MGIPYWDVFPALASAIPGFEAAEEDQKEPLPYVFLHEMAKFVCLRKSEIEMDQFSTLIEQLLVEGDDEVRYLAMDGIETLAEQAKGHKVARRFGPRALQIWNSVYGPRSWDGMI